MSLLVPRRGAVRARSIATTGCGAASAADDSPRPVPLAATATPPASTKMPAPHAETATATALTTTPLGDVRCGDVGFEAKSDHGAFSIEALGSDCATARSVAAASRARWARTFRSHRFGCAPTSNFGELPSVRDTRTAGSATSTFLRT